VAIQVLTLLKIVTIILFISCGIGLAADFSQKDLGYIEDEPFSFYTPELLKKAEQGDLEAQFNISRCFESGWGVVMDKKESEKWLLKGVKAKYPPSLYAYASKLIAVENKNKDIEAAIPLLEEAHKQKYYKATYALSGILSDNTADPTNETPKKLIDVKRSDKLLVEAAEAGECYAQGMLGNRIIFKNRIEDLETLTSIKTEDGIKWYEKAAFKQDANAAGELVGFYKYGPNDIQKNPALQEKWEKIFFDILKRVVALNDDKGGFWDRVLALYYLDAKGTDKNEAKAFIHMYNAALGGDFKAKYEVGYLFEKGIGIPKNIDEAVKWYAKCKDDPVSLKNLKRDFNQDPKWKESELVVNLMRESESPTNPQ